MKIPLLPFFFGLLMWKLFEAFLFSTIFLFPFTFPISTPQQEKAFCFCCERRIWGRVKNLDANVYIISFFQKIEIKFWRRGRDEKERSLQGKGKNSREMKKLMGVQKSVNTELFISFSILLKSSPRFNFDFLWSLAFASEQSINTKKKNAPERRWQRENNVNWKWKLFGGGGMDKHNGIYGTEWKLFVSLCGFDR